MKSLEVSEVRKDLFELINQVAYQHERITVRRRGKPVMVMVPVEDAALLERLEDAHDLKLVKASLAEAGENISLADVKRELGL